MAIRTVAQAAADIRLSSDKANADFERIRRDLIAKAQRLEADIALSIPITLDQQSLQDAAAEVDVAFADLPPITVSLTFDTDEVLDELSAIQSLAQEIEFRIPVLIDSDAVTAEIEGLVSTDARLDLPVEIDSEAAIREIEALDEIETEVEVPVRANTGQVLRDLQNVQTLTGGGFVLKFRGDTRQVRADIDSIPPVDIPILTRGADQAVADVRAVSDAAEPAVIPVIAETDEAVRQITTIQPSEPVRVPVTFEQVGPGISSAGLSRIRADLAEAAALASQPLVVPIDGDLDPLRADITALGGANVPPVVVPVTGDTDPLAAELVTFTGPGGPPGGPVVVPVEVDSQGARVRATEFTRDLNREVEAGAAETGRRSGEALGREFSASASRVLTLTAITLGGLLASSLVEGFQRFTTIEDSTASLTVALQSASEAGQVLADVLNVVRGTPFRLDDFARAATNMISFGIAAEKIPRFLTAIGEAAATRGSQANQFAQSLSTIFGQIQAIGRINGEDVWQFGNVGVDVLRILGNTVGETTEEIRKMISEGAIPAEFALEAIASGILNGTTGINGATVAFSGVMEKLGDTLSGSIENFGAARARFGVAIIDPLSDTLIEGFQSLTKVVDDFTARVRVSFDNLAESDAADRVREFFEELPGLIDPAVEALSGLGPALAPLAIAFGALGLGAISNVLGPLGALVPGVTSLAGAATVAAAAFAILTPEIRDELLPALVDIGKVGADVGGTFVRGLSDALDEVSPVAIRAIGVVRDQLPAIQTFLGAAMSGLSDVGEAALPILDKLVTFAEDALPVAFRIATDGVALLAETAAAAAPVVEQLVDAGIDLIPTVSAIVDAGEALGTVLIPVLGTLGEVIGAIPVGVLQTLLGVFLGFKAVSFVQSQVTGISGALTSLRGQLSQTQVMFNQFRIQGQNSIQAFGSAVGTLRNTGSIAATAGATIAGAFSGMALASEDAATRISGAVGSIGSVLAGFATGGIAGGVFATIGVGIGLIAEGFIDGQREAEELERSIESLADKIRDEFDDDLINLEGVINSRVFADLVDEALGPEGFDLLKSLNIDKDAIQAAALEGEAAFGEFMDGLVVKVASTKGAVDDLGITDALLADLVKLSDEDLLSALTIQFPTANIQDINDAINAIGDARGQLEGLPELYTAIVSGTDAAIAKQFVLGETFTETGDAAESAGEEAARKLEEWKRATAETTLSTEELRAMLTETGEEAVSAADLATEAFEEFGDVLDVIRGKLDLTVATQQLNADLRGVGESLNEVINLDDLNQVDRINDDIARARDRISDLQGRLAEETARANEEAGLLEQRIAKAEAIGAVNAAAELRRQLGEVFDDATGIQGDIDDEFAKIEELRQQLGELTTEPITRMQQLTAQAAALNISLFELLLAGPTPEAASFFQDEIAGTVSRGLARAKQIAETDGPIAGAEAAEEFLGAFRTSLTDAGIDPTTVNQIIAQVFPASDLETLSQQAAETAIAAFLAELDAVKNDPEATTLEIKSTALSLEQQATEIETFLEEHPDITLAAELDTTDFDAAIETLRQRASQIDIEAERRRFGERNPEGLNDFIAATQTDAEEAAQESAQRILDEINALDPDTMEVPVRVTGIQSEVEQLQTFLNETGVDLPVSLSIESINNQLTQAQTQASIAAAIEGLVPNFFHSGGITGYDAPHVPQIAHGYRVWAEPETGGEAYLPLGLNKRVSAMGVFMKVAEIFDMDVRPREPKIVMPTIAPLPFTAPEQHVHVHVPWPESEPFAFDNTVALPDITKMFQAIETAAVDTGVIRKAVFDALAASRRPLTQEDYERNVIVERIEKLVIGDGESARKRASEFVSEMRLRAARV